LAVPSARFAYRLDSAARRPRAREKEEALEGAAAAVLYWLPVSVSLYILVADCFASLNSLKQRGGSEVAGTDLGPSVVLLR